MKIRVRFQGRDLIWLKNADGEGALAPPEHIDEDGNVNAYDALFSDSFAHVCEGGRIMRYGRQIGRVEDLELLGEMPDPN